MSRQGGTWATAVAVAKAVKRLPPLQRAATVLVAVLAGLGIALGILGWMKPVAETRRNEAAPGQSMTFSYSASVPPSAAYEGTTVSSPEPIFRKLTDTVVLHLRYQGRPGTVVVNATLSDGTGWHRSMMIAPWKKFSGQTYNAAVNLKLGVFGKRAQEAAKAIGSQLGPVTVLFTARVTHGGERAFTAPLTFSLNPLAFTLTGGAGSLVVDSKTATPAETVVPREIEVLDRSILTASQARTYAVLMLLGSLVCAVKASSRRRGARKTVQTGAEDPPARHRYR